MPTFEDFLEAEIIGEYFKTQSESNQQFLRVLIKNCKKGAILWLTQKRQESTLKYESGERALSDHIAIIFNLDELLEELQK